MTQFFIFVVLGYLMGSISSAVLVCKMSGLPDPRTEGSKNPGATNVLRLAGKQYAALVMAGDVLKGTLPVVLAQWFGADPTVLAFTGLAAVTGHIYPVFFEFKGGKGVATALGALFGMYFMLGVVVAAIWLVVAKLWKYSSLASLCSMLAAPVVALGMTGNLNIFPPILAMTILIFYKHSNNINRLLDGTEPKIKLKKDIISEVMESSPMTNIPESESEAEEVVIKAPVVEKPKRAKKPAAKKPAVKKAPTKEKAPTKKASATPKKAAAPKPKKTKESK